MDRQGTGAPAFRPSVDCEAHGKRAKLTTMTASLQDLAAREPGAEHASWTDHEVELPGRGRTSVREAQGPPHAPTVVLLHGLAATGRLNWFTALPALSERFRVIVVDHRGHGRGIRTPHFRLADCADDAVAVADHLGVASFIAVGYSMGGPIAKLCWSRHRDRVRGLVLCATANHFLRPEAQGAVSAVFPGMVVAARLMPRFFLDRIIDGMTRGIPAGERRDRVRREMEPSDPATMLQAARAVIRFSSRDWVAGIDVPTAVVITTQDQLVPPRRQYRLATSIPGARVFEVSGDHLACVSAAEQFVPALVEACEYVHARGLDDGQLDTAARSVAISSTRSGVSADGTSALDEMDPEPR
jgi:3-oxoadipate enol-lactonase